MRALHYAGVQRRREAVRRVAAGKGPPHPSDNPGAPAAVVRDVGLLAQVRRVTA
jgi:hypothetical protein